MKHLLLSCIESRVENNSSIYGRFQLGPFNLGQGLTVANALRRTLLSELEGLAITAVEIDGVNHEYSTIQGVRESVLDILLNIKEIILTSNIEIQEPEIAYLQFKGPGVVKSRDIKFPFFIQCVDPEQYIATLSHDSNLSIKFIIFQGKNYFLQTSESQILNSKMKSINKNLVTKNLLTTNYLPIDAIFMPVKKVNFILENYTEMEQIKDRIILEVWTNGSIHPKKAIHNAAKNLVELFSSFQENPFLNYTNKNKIKLYLRNFFKKNKTHKKIIFNLNSFSKGKFSFPSFLNSGKIQLITKRNFLLDKKLSFLNISHLDFSLRTYTCLKRANVKTIENLLEYSKEELLLLKNFDFRSLREVENILFSLGLVLKKKA